MTGGPHESRDSAATAPPGDAAAVTGGPHESPDSAATAPPGDAAAVRVFPPGVPLATVLAGVGLDRLWPLDPAIAPPPLVRYGLGGAIVVGAVLLLGLWSVILVRRSGQSENPWKPTLSLIDKGPFRVTRNPMYLQMVLACVGFAVLLWNPWILLLTPVCAWVLHRFAILPEEAYLQRRFPDAYRAYKARTRRWL